jgi:hypothetical protein
MEQYIPGTYYQPLYDYMKDQFGISLLISESEEILSIAGKAATQPPSAPVVEEIINLTDEQLEGKINEIRARLGMQPYDINSNTIWQCHNPKCNAQYAEYVNGCPKCSTGEPGGSHKVSIFGPHHPSWAASTTQGAVSANATEVYELRVSLYRLLKAFKDADKTDLQKKRYDEAEYILQKNFNIKDVLRTESRAASTTQGAVSQDAHEKEVMMQAFDKVRKIFEMRSWVMEGRGSYPYNDDRYKKEVYHMYNEFDALFKETWANIDSKSFEYRKQIIAQYLKENPPLGAVWVQGDYDRLYDQVKSGKRTVCYVDYNRFSETVYRDICTIKAETMEFTSRGVGYGGVAHLEGATKDDFIQLCKEMNVEWLDETGSQRQAGPGWVKATQVLPTFGQQLFVKFNGSKYLAETYDEAPNDQVPKISFFFDGRHHFEDEYHLIEYLNESTPSKEDALNDALKWVFENRRGIIHVESAHQLNELYQKFSNLDTFIPPSKEGDAIEFFTWAHKTVRGYDPITDLWIMPDIEEGQTTEQLYKLYQQNK